MSFNNNINYNQQVPMASTVPVQGTPPAQMYPQSQPMPGYQQPSYGVDQTQFSAPRPIAQPTPAVEIGFFDKVKSYFNDVYRSDENLRAYKVFQQTVDTDPNTIQPGSSNKASVTELQQRLNIAGVPANVNGIYGYATGEAVKDFKKMMNLNDGFLDGNGQPAITDIATPQMQSVLNSVIGKQLNPQMPGTGNPMPVTQEELLWAQNLATRIQNFGYQPNTQERARYTEIQGRQQAQSNPGMHPVPNSPTVPGVPTPGQPPYQPQPTTPYQPQPTTPYNPGGTPPVQPVSQQELDWAMQMQERIVGGYRPNAQEASAYESIQQRYSAQQTGQSNGPQPSGQLNPVSQAELDWAVDMQDRISNKGYSPTPAEAARYTDIFNRYQNQPAAPVQPTAPVKPATPVYQPGTTPALNVDNSVTQAELQWAVDLQSRIDNQKYQPTQQEVVRYTDIFNRYQASQAVAPSTPVAPSKPSSPTAPTSPTAPAAPVQPSNPAMGSVGYIVLGNAHPRGTMHIWGQAPKDPSGINGPTGDWNIDKSRLHYLSPDGNQTIAQTQMNSSIAGQLTPQWRLIYTPPTQAGQQPVTAPRPGAGAPSGPANAAGASQQEVQWAKDLEARVVSGYQPTAGEVSKYNDIQMKLAIHGVQASAPGAAVTPQPVTQAELDWAMQLQHRVQFQGYQPTDQEIGQYTDIFDRYQKQPTQPVTPVASAPAPTAPTAPAAPVASGAPSAEEIQWAQQLQTMVQQGYQATESEVARYTDIFNRMQQSPGAAPTAPVAPAAPAPTTAPGSVMINVNAADPELQWAMELLNRHRQGYQPSQSELMMYERIIATKAVPNATP